MNDETTFSWLKAFGHATAIAAVFLAPSLLLAAAGMVNATKAGEFAGGFVVFGFILGWIWSYARQTAHSTTKHVLTFILVAMSAYEVFVLAAAAVTRKRSPSLASIASRPPTFHQTASGSVLCQQDVHLRLDLGALALAPAPELTELVRQKDPNGAVARWVYREPAGDVVVLMAARGFDSEESLRNFAKGAANGAEGRMEKIRESIEWSGGRGTIGLAYRLGESSRFDLRCISAPGGDLACIQTIGAEPGHLAGLRDQLSFGSCP